mmetsp:Transcript_2863/g.8748  ORF Transcript_2863/g.8748 Transcript_2863/m.8748 type:complete len:236 (-) Transcript_2863:1032-1739(-)
MVLCQTVGRTWRTSVSEVVRIRSRSISPDVAARLVDLRRSRALPVPLQRLPNAAAACARLRPAAFWSDSCLQSCLAASQCSLPLPMHWSTPTCGEIMTGIFSAWRGLTGWGHSEVSGWCPQVSRCLHFHGCPPSQRMGYDFMSTFRSSGGMSPPPFAPSTCLSRHQQHWTRCRRARARVKANFPRRSWFCASSSKFCWDSSSVALLRPRRICILPVPPPRSWKTGTRSIRCPMWA